MSRNKNSRWSLITEYPPLVFGITGAFMLVFEGRILGTLLVLILCAIHRYAGYFLTRAYFASSHGYADWAGIHSMTAFTCLGLPIYLALTS